MGCGEKRKWVLLLKLGSSCLLLLLSLLTVQASVHEYEEGEFVPSGNAFLYYGGSEGMRASTSKDSGSKGGIANGRSYIRFDSITFRRTSDSAAKYTKFEPSTGLVQALVFEEGDRDKIGGSSYSGHAALCCTPDLAELEGCNQGQVIRRPSRDNRRWPRVISAHFKGDELEASMPSDLLNITKTGMYNLYFVFCDPQLKGLVMNGRTVWKNPTGYLPGRMAPLMTFYGFMSLAYLVLGLAWFLQYLRYWEDTFHLQISITVVITLGMFEMSLWYFEYANFNSTGRRPVGITLWAVSFGVVKKTVSRLLILVVSMGYGVLKPTLGGLTSKVALLGVSYLTASELLDVVEHVGSINDLSGKARLFLVLPVAILDAFFIIWIFSSLSKTLEKLQARLFLVLPVAILDAFFIVWIFSLLSKTLEKIQARRRFTKLELYRRLTNSLVIAVLVSVAWIGFELYFKATDPFSQRWQSAWVISAFWSVLSFAVLCVICFLWAPSHNSIRYGYSKEAEDDFDDDETINLKPNAAVEMEKSNVKQDKKDRKAMNADVFGLDDPEEDKRE